MSRTEQCLARPPEHLWFHRGKEISTFAPSASRNKGYDFLMVWPLYGLRESPLIWFIHLSCTRRRIGFRRCRVDICNSTFRNGGTGKIICRLLTYVDDIMVSYRGSGLEVFNDSMKNYRCGELGKLDVGHKLMFLGMDVFRATKDEIQLRQKSFIARMQPIDLVTIVEKGN